MLFKLCLCSCAEGHPRCPVLDLGTRVGLHTPPFKVGSSGPQTGGYMPAAGNQSSLDRGLGQGGLPRAELMPLPLIALPSRCSAGWGRGSVSGPQLLMSPELLHWSCCELFQSPVPTSPPGQSVTAGGTWLQRLHREQTFLQVTEMLLFLRLACFPSNLMGVIHSM